VIEEALDIRGRPRAFRPPYDSSLVKNCQGGNRHHLESVRQAGMILRIGFDYEELSRIGRGDAFDLRRETAAGRTPRRPKIHQRWQRGISRGGVKFVFRLDIKPQRFCSVNLS
jgi:hypothetical protein